MSIWKNSWYSLLYYFRRIKTILYSFYYLLNLTPKQVENFFDSYNLYNEDWVELKKLYSTEEIRNKLQHYYHLMPFMLSFGPVEKMYIPPVLNKKKSILENQMMFESLLSKALNVNPGKKILDIGCGRGLVALQVAENTQSHITGINIEKTQLEFAKTNFEQKGKTKDSFDFKYADINNLPLPFENETFDAIYEIQVLSLCDNFEELIKEIARILKSSGRFVSLDWVKLEGFDEKSTYHQEILRQVKPLIGAIGTQKVQDYTHIIAKYFEIHENRDLSAPHGQSILIQEADTLFCRLKQFVNKLVSWNLLSNKISLLLERLTLAGKQFIEGDQLRIFTTSYYVVGTKKNKTINA